MDTQKLLKRKKQLEQRQDVKEYLEWEKLSPKEKARIRKIWEDYYEKVWFESKEAERFRKQSEAFKLGKLELVKAYAQKAREDMEIGYVSIPRPTKLEPAKFDHGWDVMQYKRILRALDETGSPF